MVRGRTGLLALLVLAGTSLGTLAPGAAQAAPAGTTKSCAASVSNAHPKQYSTEKVSVSKVSSGAKVTTVAHYKSKNTSKGATADKNGHATTSYDIGRATHGYQVVVKVTATKGSTHWSCQTSFTTK